MTIEISGMKESDWADVARIYREGIETGNSTFENTPPSSWEEWSEKKVNECSLVARDDGVIVGWAAVSPFSKRPVYEGVVENSLYVATSARGKGVGVALLEELIRVTESFGIWSIQSRIFPENTASLRLHLSHGFREVGILEKIGQMQFGENKGKWRDVVFVERRSKTVGF